MLNFLVKRAVDRSNVVKFPKQFLHESFDAILFHLAFLSALCFQCFCCYLLDTCFGRCHMEGRYVLFDLSSEKYTNTPVFAREEIQG